MGTRHDAEVVVDTQGRAVLARSDGTVEHTVTILKMAERTRGGVALNVASTSRDDSTMYVTGHETDRGTIKVAHHGDGGDANAAALSIDLKGAGTAAQGIYLTATDGPTTGALLVLRNNPGRDDVTVEADGSVGIGVPRGGTPWGRVEVRQVDDLPGVVVRGHEGARGPLAQFRAADATVVLTVEADGSLRFGGGELFAEAGALKWRGSRGTVTTIAPA